MRRLEILLLAAHLTLFSVGPAYCEGAELQTKRFDVNYYHFISMDSTGSRKEKELHVEGARVPECWKDLSKDDIATIDWLEHMGVPFCDVEGAFLVHHNKRSIRDALDAGEEGCGYIEVTNTQINLDILEYKLLSRTNQFLKSNDRVSEQVAIEGFPVPTRIEKPFFEGFNQNELMEFFEGWDVLFPDSQLHSVRKRVSMGGRYLSIRYDPEWDRSRGFWKFKVHSLSFSKDEWSEEYDDLAFMGDSSADDFSEIHLSFYNNIGVVIRGEIDDSEFSSLMSKLREVREVQFNEQTTVSGKQAISFLTEVAPNEDGYFLSFRGFFGGYHLVCSIEDEALKVRHVLQEVIE